MLSLSERIEISCNVIADRFEYNGKFYTCKICRSIYASRDGARKHFGKKHDPLRGKHKESVTAWRSLLSAEGTCSLCGYRPTLQGGKDTFQSFRMHLDSRHPGKRREAIIATISGVETDNITTEQLNFLADETSNREHIGNLDTTDPEKHPAVVSASFNRESRRAWRLLFDAEDACTLCNYRIDRHFGQGWTNIFETMHRHLTSRHPEKLEEVISAAMLGGEAKREVVSVASDGAGKEASDVAGKEASDVADKEASNSQLNLCESSSEWSQSGGIASFALANHFITDGNTFTCRKCRFVWTSSSTAWEHFRGVHDAVYGKYKECQIAWRTLISAEGTCTLCGFKLTRALTRTFGKVVFHSLRKHLDSRHPGKCQEVVSAALDSVFKEASQLLADDATANRVYASVPEEGYVCSDCDLSFTSIHDLMQHRNEAHPIAPTSLSCLECGKVFSTMLEQRKHKHVFLCRNCGVRISTEAARNSHMLRCQRPRDQFPCPLCGKSFDAERLLKAHLAMKHQPIRLGEISKQVDIVKEPGRKRPKLEVEVHQSSVSPEANATTVGITHSWDCVEPKQDSDASDINSLISFAIVKEEVEDDDSFNYDACESKTLPVKIEHDPDTAGNLSEMTVSMVNCNKD